MCTSLSALGQNLIDPALSVLELLATCDVDDVIFPCAVSG